MHTSAGLSPRVRGNLGPDTGGFVRNGSIPARAGEPISPLTAAQVKKVYPRACGGTASCPTQFSPLRGLSPRVRGNLVLDCFAGCAYGSIPARAGEPRTFITREDDIKVYPRACGGTSAEGGSAGTLVGLSPRVRGNRNMNHPPMIPEGSIPARAGEPASANCPDARPTVYPRACGGTRHQLQKIYPPWGLSPRVRGNLIRDEPEVWQVRSIPARAGEPSGSIGWWGRRGVYPRACGGTHQQPLAYTNITGLSPRVRGNLADASPSPAQFGSIPARAGEPALTASSAP